MPVARAAYNANIDGTVTSVITYTSGELLFIISNQPTSDGSCAATYFEIDSSDTVSDAVLGRMVARLLEAHALGETVDIGYDSSGTVCSADGYIPAYRIG